MKVESREGKVQRKILIAMIVNKEVLAKISDKWVKDGLFRSKWCNVIGGWCVKYFNKYSKPPGRSIEGMYESWSEGKDKETSASVERFLNSLSEEYEQLTDGINAEYILDAAAKHFNEVRAEKLAEEIEGCISRDKLEDVYRKIASFTKIEIGSEGTVNVLQDKDAIREAFEKKRESIVKYRGALGKFFGDSLERDAFIAFMAPEKTGKSYWLLDFAWEGMLQRNRVALFEVGDMSKAQVMKRMMARVSGRPLKPTKPEKPVRYPLYITHVPGEKFSNVDYDERHFKKVLDWRTAWKACQKAMTNKIKSQEPMLKLSCHPNSSISVAGIRSILDGWERQGWVPDIVVIDYADILAPMNAAAESRDQINATWKALRALSQSLHCLVVTATQSKATSYTTETLSRKDFADDKRKFAHVTGMIGINQTEEEKGQDITRLNWIVLREDEFSVSKCVHVAGCRAVGRIAVKSTW